MSVPTPLRQQQVKQLRTAVLEAVIAKLESTAPDDVSMADIAQSAGISLRTLYRYFPDRASLLQSAGEYLYGSLKVPVEIAAPEDIARSFIEAAQRLAQELEEVIYHSTAYAGFPAANVARRAALETLRKEKLID